MPPQWGSPHRSVRRAVGLPSEVATGCVPARGDAWPDERALLGHVCAACVASRRSSRGSGPTWTGRRPRWRSRAWTWRAAAACWRSCARCTTAAQVRQPGPLAQLKGADGQCAHRLLSMLWACACIVGPMAARVAAGVHTGAVARNGGLPELPTTLVAFPELQAIITSCW